MIAGQWWIGPKPIFCHGVLLLAHGLIFSRLLPVLGLSKLKCPLHAQELVSTWNHTISSFFLVGACCWCLKSEPRACYVSTLPLEPCSKPIFPFSYFSERFWHFHPRPASDQETGLPVSCVAGITGMYNALSVYHHFLNNIVTNYLWLLVQVPAMPLPSDVTMVETQFSVSSWVNEETISS
jgi:hypothetical protein